MGIFTHFSLMYVILLSDTCIRIYFGYLYSSFT